MIPCPRLPKPQFLTASYPTPSPHSDLVPFLLLLQCRHITLPGWLLSAPLLQPDPFPSQTSQQDEELGAQG